MSSMLRGNALAKVDEKGRLKLPKSFRNVIEPEYGTEFFVTSHGGGSIQVYPMAVWEEIELRLAQAPSFNPSVMRFKNLVNYYGQSVAMDSQGRILLHPLVRDRAEVDGEVAVLGLHDHLEVWNRATFEEKLRTEPLTSADLESLSRFGV